MLRIASLRDHFLLVVLAIIFVNIASAQGRPPQESSGAAAYPEVAKLARFFIKQPLADRPTHYHIPTKALGSDAPGTVYFVPVKSPDYVTQIASCQADLVVFAVPVEQRTYLAVDNRWVFTDYTLQFVDVVRTKLHEEPPETITYIHPGGETTAGGRNVSTEVSRYPKLLIGRRHLFFLKRIDVRSFRAVNVLPYLRPIPPKRIESVSEDFRVWFGAPLESNVIEWVKTASCSEK